MVRHVIALVLSVLFFLDFERMQVRALCLLLFCRPVGGHEKHILFCLYSVQLMEL